MKYVFAAMGSIVLVGCTASPSEKLSRDIDESKGVICTNEIPTGSSIRERKCTTAQERDDQRRQSDLQVVVEPGRGNAR